MKQAVGALLIVLGGIMWHIAAQDQAKGGKLQSPQDIWDDFVSTVKDTSSVFKPQNPILSGSNPYVNQPGAPTQGHGDLIEE